MSSFRAANVMSAWLTGATLGLITATASLAAETAADDILLREVYVPAGEPSAWPTDGEAYLPVAARRLEQLIENAKPDVDETDLPRVLETELYAQVDELGNLTGSGAMRLQRASDSNAPLPLKGRGIWIGEANWRDMDLPVRSGYWGARRGLAIEVAVDGWLDFEWRASPRNSELEEPEFRIELPDALTTTLVLDLPVGTKPEPMAHGDVLVFSTEEALATQEFSDLLAGDLPRVAPGSVRWLLRAGTGRQLAWRVRTPTRQVFAESQRPAFTERLDYRLTDSGIDVRQQFEVLAPNGMPRAIDIDAPASLVVRSITWNDVALRPQRRADQLGYELSLPNQQGAGPGSATLVVDGWHALPSALSDLPQVIPRGFYWLAGEAQVQIAPSLQLIDARKRNVVEIAPGSVGGSVLTYEKLGARGALQVAVGRRSQDNAVQVGRVVSLSKSDTKATVYTNFVDSPSQGLRVLAARLIDRWQPRTVSAEPPFAVDEWYVTDGERGRRLVVRVALAREVEPSAKTPLRLAVQADRAISASEEWLRLDECDALRWEDAVAVDELFALQVEEGMQVESNPRPAPLSEELAMPYLGTLLPATLAAPVYDRRQIDPATRLYLKPTAARLDVAIATEILDQEDAWRVDHRLECAPIGGAIERLRLTTRSVTSDNLEWRLDASGPWQTAMAVEDSDESDRPATWTIDLPARQSRPFLVQLREARTSAAQRVYTPLELEGANQTQHVVEIRSAQARRLEVETNGWDLVATVPDGQIPLHSRWVPDAGVEVPTLTVRRSALGEAMPMATVQHAHIRSVFAPSAVVRHRISFAIQNQAESEVVCELPNGAIDIRWRRATDEAMIAAAESRQIVLPLDQTDELQQFELEFSTAGGSLHHGATVAAPWPRLDIPVTKATWTVVAPSTYATIASTTMLPDRSAIKRLFGWLAASSEVSDSRSNTSGFASTELVAPDIREATVTFRHRPTIAAQLCFVFAASMLVGYLLWARTTYLSMALALSASACLVLPVATYAWATAAWGGLLFAMAIRGLEVVTHSFRRWAAESNATSLGLPSAGILLLAAGLVGVPAVAGEPSSARIESIFIPFDKEGQVVGDQRYVTSRLYSELLRREQGRSMANAWVTTSPRYTGKLGKASDGRCVPADGWEVAFDLEVFRADVSVVLPIQPTDAEWASQVTLDGVPAALTWSAEGASFRVPRVGRYRARLQFVPQFRQLKDRAEISVQIPPMQGGTVEVDFPAAVEEVFVDDQPVASANGNGATRVVPLTGGDRLAISWSQTATALPTSLLTQQWLWLDIASGQATVDAVFRLPTAWNESTELQPLVNGEPVNPSQASDYGGWQLVEPVEVEALSSGDCLARLRLTLERTQQYGRVRVPTIDLSGAETTQRQLALSFPSGLLATAKGVQSIDSAGAFSNFWPDRPQPRETMGIPHDASDIAVVLKPTASGVVPDEAVEVGCFSDRIELVYRGSFSRRARATSYQAFRLSPDLEVADVQIDIDGESRSAAFSQPDDGRLMVFFGEPLTKPIDIVVFGARRLPTSDVGSNSTNVEVPRITVAGENNITQRIGLYADDKLTASVVDADVVPQLVETPSEPLATWNAYGVTSLLVPAAPTTPILLRIGENRPRFEVATLTTLIRQDNTWIVEMGLLIDVVEGNLPEIDVEWPLAMTNEIEVDGAAFTTLDSSAEGVASRLRLRFARAAEAGQRARVVLRSAVRDPSSRMMVCPVINVGGAEVVERYFGLPDLAGGQWSWRRAKPAVAPASIEGLLAGWPDAQLLQASRTGRPLVRWVANARGEASYRIPLANASLQTTGLREATMRTQLVLPALGVGSVDIRVPDDQQLLSVLIDDRPAVVAASPAGVPRLALPNSRLPHVVEIVTTGVDLASASGVDLPGLTVDGKACMVEHRLWSIAGPAGDRFVPASAAERLSEVEVAALRLTQLLSAAAGYTRQAGTTPSWANIWLVQISEAEGSLRRAMSQSESQAPQIVDAMSATDEYDVLLGRARGTIERLQKVAGVATPVEAESGELTTPRRLFVQSSEEPLRWSGASASPSYLVSRFLLALACLGLAGLRIATRDHEWPIPASREWLFPIAIVLGLTWWLLLWPRVLGLLLALAAILAWLRYNQYRH